MIVLDRKASVVAIVLHLEKKLLLVGCLWLKKMKAVVSMRIVAQIPFAVGKGTNSEASSLVSVQ